MLSAARPALKIAASSLRRHRNVSSMRRPTMNNSYVPLITVTACAITSGSMYYYLMNRVKNESESSESITEKLAEKPVEVIEILEDQVTSEGNEIIEVTDVVIPVEEVKEIVHEVAESVEEVGSVENLEEEASKEGAFNEETGEINWDCPCLGGMAHGPCGEEFKAAFSCFVYSKEEPKGIECIEKFKGMQDCFRRYPDVYSEELRDEEALQEEVTETKKAVEQAVMNNDIIESVEEAVEEAKEIKEEIKKNTYDLYAAAQKKIDDFHKK